MAKVTGRFQRTYEELKQSKEDMRKRGLPSFQRTYEELKLSRISSA